MPWRWLRYDGDVPGTVHPKDVPRSNQTPRLARFLRVAPPQHEAQRAGGVPSQSKQTHANDFGWWLRDAVNAKHPQPNRIQTATGPLFPFKPSGFGRVHPEINLNPKPQAPCTRTTSTACQTSLKPSSTTCLLRWVTTRTQRL